MHMGLKLTLQLYGGFAARWSDGTRLDVSGTKLKALLALLATAPGQEVERVWLQDMLWGSSSPEQGQASVRQALSQLRRRLADRADDVLATEGKSVRLKPGAVILTGDPGDGVFLDGIDVAEERFEDWLRVQRSQSVLPAAAGQPAALSEQLLPTVATMPFQMFTLEPGAEPLGDMLAQEISRALSRSQFLQVISHLSARRIDAQKIVVDDIREKMGADYVICGSLRLSGQAMVAVVDLVDVSTGLVLWTRDFQGPVDGFLQGGSGLVWDIATQAGRGIIMSALELAAVRPMPSTESHTLLMSSIGLMHRQSPAGFNRSRTQIEEVLGRVPGHSIVHAWLAKWYVLNVQQGWSADQAADARIAADCCKRALDLNPDCTFALAVDGFVKNNLLKRLDDAAARFDEAISIDPNNAFAWLLKGTLFAFEGRGSEAVACTNRARILSPLDPYGYFFDSLSATACASAEDYENALRLAERSLAANRRHTSTLRVRTVSLEMLGRHEDARQSAADLLRVDPDFTIEQYLSQHPAAMFATGRSWAKALAAAGVPRK